MNLKAFISECKTYGLQIVAVVTILSSVFAYGVSTEKGRNLRSQEKADLAALKDSSLFYYRATVNEVSNIREITKGTYDTVQHINTKLSFYNLKVDLLTASYRQSLILNPGINKEQYSRLTEGIDNLMEELKKNENKIVQDN